MKGYKGFDKDFRCRDFQYEPGKSYETKKAKACSTGFHFCEHPLDIFKYYPPSGNRFAEVEGDGDIDHHNVDTKIACTKITIGVEIGIHAMVQAAASATGDQGAASATGVSGRPLPRATRVRPLPRAKNPLLVASVTPVKQKARLAAGLFSLKETTITKSKPSKPRRLMEKR